MLKFIKLTMHNFGCYKGTKEIDFSDKDGVTLVWGNNGYGKTTLLNAIRYVLFEEIKGRHNNKISPKDMINWADNTTRSFYVSLEFEYGGMRYILTRKYGIIDPTRDPDNPKNYRAEPPNLWRDGTILSQNNTQHILNSIMPREVSRFFLFDGELLEEYESLLQEEDAIGRKIKTAIEEILGVPVLTNALTDLNTLAAQYDKEMTTASMADKDSKNIGNAILRATNELETLKKSLKEHEGCQHEYSMELESIDAEMKKNDALKTLISDIEAKERFIKDRESNLNSYRKQIEEKYSANAWKYALHDVVVYIIDDKSKRITTLDEKRKQNNIAGHMLGEFKKSISEKVCVVCDTSLDDAELKRVQEKIDRFTSQYPELTNEELQEYQKLNKTIEVLSEINVPSGKDAIAVIESDIMDCLTDIADAKQKITDLKHDFDDYAKEKKEIEELNQSYDKTLKLLQNEVQCIEQQKKDILQKEADLKKMRDKLNGMTGISAELRKAQKNSSFCHRLSELFDGGLDTYRNHLKKQVEEDATEIFINLSNDPSYKKLIINDNYGLNIEHESGKIINVRSAGFEQIVAISLIGALHKNAPLQGPVVMDSPFGRIDSVHEANIIKYLPHMANQVMLFVYDTEINAEKAIVSLGNQLVQQYELKRGTPHETIIGRKY